MRSVGVVVDPPFLDDLASLVEIGEQVLVQAFVTQAAVKAFDKTVLHRLAGRDVVPLDPAFLLPGQNGIRGELGAVVAHDHAWATPAFDDVAKFAHHTQGGERGIDDQAQAFPGGRSSGTILALV